MSARKAAATAVGRALLKAGSRFPPAAARGGGGRGSKVARGLASVSLNQLSSQHHQHRGTQGALFAGVSCAALAGMVALLKSEDLEGVLPAFLLEKLQRQVSSPKALARIEEVRYDSTKKVRGEREEDRKFRTRSSAPFSGSAAPACSSTATASTSMARQSKHQHSTGVTMVATLVEPSFHHIMLYARSLGARVQN